MYFFPLYYKHDERDVQHAGLSADLATVEVELKNLTAALARGAAVASVLDGIKERESRKRDLRARLDALDAEDRAAGRAGEGDYLDGLRKVCTSWRKLLNADPAHGRRVLRDLRIDRVPVRQDDRGRWWYRLEGSLDKILGITGRTARSPTRRSCRGHEDFGETDDLADGPAEPYQEGSCPRGDSNTRHAV